jgi:superfamily II DNA or RNA helicase
MERSVVLARDARLVGKRIRVHWPDDDAWYAGLITGYSSRRGHCVKYDHVPGESDRTEYEDLEDLVWEFENSYDQQAQTAKDSTEAFCCTPSLATGNLEATARRTAAAAGPVRRQAAGSSKAPVRRTAAASATRSLAADGSSIKRDETAVSAPEVEVSHDSDVEEIEGPVRRSQPPAGSSSFGGPIDSDSDDELVCMGHTGELALQDFPHARENCVAIQFARGLEQKHCILCYCFVCDGLAADCEQWQMHAKALAKSPYWQRQRTAARVAKDAAAEAAAAAKAAVKKAAAEKVAVGKLKAMSAEVLKVRAAAKAAANQANAVTVAADKAERVATDAAVINHGGAGPSCERSAAAMGGSKRGADAMGAVAGGKKACVATSSLPPEQPLMADWSCPACTYFNLELLDACEMCETPKPGMTLPAPSASLLVSGSICRTKSTHMRVELQSFRNSTWTCKVVEDLVDRGGCSVFTEGTILKLIPEVLEPDPFGQELVRIWRQQERQRVSAQAAGKAPVEAHSHEPAAPAPAGWSCDRVLKSITMGSVYPLEETEPAGLKKGTKLRTYQKQSLAFMLERERSTDPKELGTGWIGTDDADRPSVSAFRLPCGVRGGYLCDEVGMGKTVVAISLILANPGPAYVAMPADGCRVTVWYSADEGEAAVPWLGVVQWSDPTRMLVRFDAPPDDSADKELEVTMDDDWAWGDFSEAGTLVAESIHRWIQTCRRDFARLQGGPCSNAERLAEACETAAWERQGKLLCGSERPQPWDRPAQAFYGTVGYATALARQKRREKLKAAWDLYEKLTPKPLVAFTGSTTLSDELVFLKATLVIVPTSLLGQWGDELSDFAPGLQVLTWHQSAHKNMNESDLFKKVYKNIDAADVVLTTSTMACKLPLLRFRRIIVDEIHTDEVANGFLFESLNSEVQRLQYGQPSLFRYSSDFRRLFRCTAPYVWLLTGTPLTRGVEELRLGAHLLGHHQYGERLTKRVIGPELLTSLRPMMIRHLKKQLIQGMDALSLPASDTRIVWLEMSEEERRHYKLAEARDGALSGIEQHGGTDFGLEMAMRHRRTACSNIYKKYSRVVEGTQHEHEVDEMDDEALEMYDRVLKKDCSFSYDYKPKIDKCSKLRALRDDLNTLRAQDPHCMAVVFTHFRETHANVASVLKLEGFHVFEIHGATDHGKRHRAIREFQGRGQAASPSGAKVLVITIRVGAVGMTLTSASRVYIMEPAFNPAAEAQAAGRIHRLGQTREVLVTKFVYRNSIEHNITKLHDKISEGALQLCNGQVPPDGVRLLVGGRCM